MTIKRVRLNQNVHKRLMYLKENSKAKSLNDVICSLIQIGEEEYLQGAIYATDKQISLRYINGKLVELKVKRD